MEFNFYQAHPSMRNYTCPNSNEKFADGIVKGGEWYSISGGMQDYNYAFANCLEITLEISCCKFPKKKLLPGFWKDNRESLVAYMEQVRSTKYRRNVRLTRSVLLTTSIFYVLRSTVRVYVS